MNKIISWILRIAVIIGMFFTMSLTLSSTISMQVSTRGLVKQAINKTASEYGAGSLAKNSWNILNALGIEDQIFAQLPKKLQVKTSYIDLYDLTSTYQKEGKITASQLNLPNNTDSQKTVNDVVIKYVNSALEQNQSDINQAISYYKIIFYIIIGLYIIGMLFVLFGKRFGIFPFLLASLGGYALIAFVTGQLQTQLQSEIYQGITVTMANGFNTSIVVAIIITIIWFWAASILKHHQKKQNKKTYAGKHAAD